MSASPPSTETNLTDTLIRLGEAIAQSNLAKIRQTYTDLCGILEPAPQPEMTSEQLQDYLNQRQLPVGNPQLRDEYVDKINGAQLGLGRMRRLAYALQAQLEANGELLGELTQSEAALLPLDSTTEIGTKLLSVSRIMHNAKRSSGDLNYHANEVSQNFRQLIASTQAPELATSETEHGF